MHYISNTLLPTPQVGKKAATRSIKWGGTELQEEEDTESDSEATRTIDVSEVAPGKDDGLVEPEPAGGIKEDTLTVTSSLRD